MITTTTAFNSANAAQLPAKKPVYVLTIANYFRAFTTQAAAIPGLIAGGITTQSSWIAGDSSGLPEISEIGAAAQDLNGDSTMTDLTVDVMDYFQQISKDRTTFTFEGQTATLYVGFAELAFADYAVLRTMRIETVQILPNQTYRFICKDSTQRLLKKVIYRTGDNGRPTSTKNPKTLGPSNPMDILLDILQNQLGFSASQYNLTAINNAKNNLFSGFLMKFTLTTAPEAMQFISLELMKALGGWHFQNFSGALTPVYEVPSAAPTVQMSFNDKDYADQPPSLEEAMLANVWSYRLQFDGSNFTAQIPEGAAGNASTAKYGMTGERVINARGVRAELGGWLMGRLVVNTLLQRYGFKAPIYVFRARFSALALELGDFIRVSSNFVPDPSTGKLGFTNKLCEILEIKVNLKNGYVDLRTLDHTWLDNQGIFQAAPDGEANFPAASPADQARYMFVCSASTGKYSNGINGNPIP